MKIIGFQEEDLNLVRLYYEHLANTYQHVIETSSGYEGRAVMIRDLLWNWTPTLRAAQRWIEEEK